MWQGAVIAPTGTNSPALAPPIAASRAPVVIVIVSKDKQRADKRERLMRQTAANLLEMLCLPRWRWSVVDLRILKRWTGDFGQWLSQAKELEGIHSTLSPNGPDDIEEG